MWPTIAELMMLRRPASTPPAFWKWFRPWRVPLAAGSIAGVGWLLMAGISLIAARWGLNLPLPAPRQLGTMLQPWIAPSLLYPVAILVSFQLVRKPIYSFAKRRFFARLRSADFEVCPGCAYILKGLPSFYTCPECGRIFHREGTRRIWVQWMDSPDEEWPDWDISP